MKRQGVLRELSPQIFLARRVEPPHPRALHSIEVAVQIPRGNPLLRYNGTELFSAHQHMIGCDRPHTMTDDGDPFGIDHPPFLEPLDAIDYVVDISLSDELCRSTPEEIHGYSVHATDVKSVVSGKSLSVRVGPGGRRSMKKK